MSDWDRLRARLSKPDFRRGRLLVALDFDGTLAELADTPRQAALSARTRRLLEALNRRRDTTVAILSGRALSDVKELVGLPQAYYAGNHGLEIEGPGWRWRHPQIKTLNRSLLKSLEEDLKEFPGAFLEHKSLGLAVHYREVAPRHIKSLAARLRGRVSPLADHFRLLPGKKALDLRSAVAWDKGHALEKIRRNLKGEWTALFVGDDRTDEEAFQTLGLAALTVRIGRVKKSAAGYVIPHRRLVDNLLETLAGRSA